MDKLKTVNAAAMVFGEDRTAALADDPMEQYHESSKLHRSLVVRELPGVIVIERTPNVGATVTRSTKRYGHLPRIALDPPAQLGEGLGDLLSRRRSRSEFSGEPIAFAGFSALAFAAMGVTRSVPTHGGGLQTFRAAPSAGAMFPIEMYAAVRSVEGLTAGIYHYDPLEHAVELVRDAGAVEAFAGAFPLPLPVETAACTFVLASVFWRSRFKYGQRSYRFALLEAGHIGQNVLLAAEALGLGAVPVGGFYDATVDELLGIDGVTEGSVYTVAVGRRLRG
jgi:SagB-type dehydrogenase family enzyme